MEKYIDDIENIKYTLHNINNTLILLTNKLNNIESKINNIEKNIETNVVDECKKMGSHIDFVETVYENVKHPLGFINNKIKQIIGSDNRYTLDNIEYNDNNIEYNDDNIL